MLRIVKWISVVIVVLAMIYISVGWYFANRIINFQTRTLEEDKKNLKIDSLADFGLSNPEPIEIPSQDVVLKGWFFETPKNDCAIIFHHGLTGTRYGGLKYTRLFQNKSCHLVLYDLRHHGESTANYGTYGYYEKFDALNVIDWLKNKTGLEDSQIGLVGESLGAAIVIQAGGSGRSFGFILADSPFSSLEKIITERAVHDFTQIVYIFIPLAFYLASLRAEFDIKDVSPEMYASNVQSPIIIAHSLQDNYTLSYHSKNIYKNISYPKKKLLLTDWNASHGKSIDKNFKAYYSEISEFLKTQTNF
ncbi:MAG: alpha/beta hydrolase [Leptospiraceae bacterium]|nr:alpha/beta hydrolase [Leptospiraceae bacterium]